MVTPHEVLTKIIRKETTFKENKLIRKTIQKELRRRKEELIRELRKRIFKERETHDGIGKLSILGPSGKKFAAIEYTPTNNNTLILHDLWVGEETYNEQSQHLLRRLGIGELLLDEAIKLAKQKGFHSIKLECPPQNLRFYQKFGFKVLKLEHRRFGGDVYILHLNLF
jgi:GNAT superfamily N-acetyltransferase